ncbi:MAG: hypothetical protein ACPHQP_03145, partial [Longimicrobiales bacterium]
MIPSTRILRSSPSRDLVASLMVMLFAAPGADAQSRDEASVLAELNAAQMEFEQFRESRTPLLRGGPLGGSCDERIGRMCIWFGGEDEDAVPGELREVGQARQQLVRELSDGFEAAPHRWILGQLVHYAVESGNERQATAIATACGIDEGWWCHALRGYAMHVANDYEDAEVAFREALAAMPEDERRAWLIPTYIVSGDARKTFEEAPNEDLEAMFELFWRLSDPLFLYDGNDRLTDHFARWVVAMNRRDAWDPIGLDWAEDLEETLIRYGRNTGYGRTHDPTGIVGRQRGSEGFGRPGGFGNSRLNDTRRMLGFHHPKSR